MSTHLFCDRVLRAYLGLCCGIVLLCSTRAAWPMAAYEFLSVARADSGQVGFIGTNPRPGITNDSEVAFSAGTSDGSIALFVHDGSGAPETVLDTADGQFTSLSGVAISRNTGRLTFSGNPSVGSSGRFTMDRNGLITLAVSVDDSIPGSGEIEYIAGASDVADDGRITFEVGDAFLDPSGIYSSTGAGLTLFVADDDPRLVGKPILINNSGQIATVVESAGAGLFSGDDPIADSVVMFGSRMFSRTVSDLRIGNDALNDSRQLAFYAGFENGDVRILRANPELVIGSVDPDIFAELSLVDDGDATMSQLIDTPGVPLPGSVYLLGIGMLGLGLRQRTNARRAF